MHSKKLLNYAMLTALFVAHNSWADTCYRMSGTAQTWFSPEDTNTQSGYVSLDIYYPSGMESLSGLIEGHITSSDGRFSKLNHNMSFSDGSSITTEGDEAVITGISNDGISYSVKETIAFKSGQGRFEKLSVRTSNATAIGELNFSAAGNSFYILGQLCFKK